MPVSPLLDQLLLLLFLGLIACAAYCDGSRFRIPNAVNLGIALLYPLHVMASPMTVHWLAALTIAAILFLAGLALFTQGLVGGGDVKLLSASALWAGPHMVLPFLVLMGLTGGVLAIAVRVAHQLRRLRGAQAAGRAADLPADAPDAPSEQVPYGIAIAAGGAYVGIRALLG